jgi:hypothetical protein
LLKDLADPRQSRKERDQKDFQIPATNVEYKEKVTRLMLVGSSESEAELVIASRKTFFHKTVS